MKESNASYDGPSANDMDLARRSAIPAWRVAAESVEDWKAREIHALERRSTAKFMLSRLFWHIQYLSAVGNGAEAERCRDGLLDPVWGLTVTRGDKWQIQKHASELAIAREKEIGPN